MEQEDVKRIQEKLSKIPVNHYLVMLEDNSSAEEIKETLITDFNEQGRELEGQLYLLYLALAKYCAEDGVRVADTLQKISDLINHNPKNLIIDHPIHQTLNGYRLINQNRINKYNEPPQSINSRLNEMGYSDMSDFVGWLESEKEKLGFTSFLVIGSIAGQFAYVRSTDGLDPLDAILPDALEYVSKKVHTPIAWSIDAIKDLAGENIGGKKLPYFRNHEDHTCNKFLYSDKTDQLKIAPKGIADVLSPDWHDRMNDVKMIKVLHHLRDVHAQEYILFAESKSTYYLGISRFGNYKQFENGLSRITEDLTDDPTYNITLKDLQDVSKNNEENVEYLDKFNFDCSNVKFYGISNPGFPDEQQFQECWRWIVNTLGNAATSGILSFLVYADGKLSIGDSITKIDDLARPLRKQRVVKLYNDLLGNIATMFENRSTEYFLNFPNQLED